MEIHHVRDTLSVLDADLAESRFSNANLARSCFDDVSLQHAAFTNANFSEATFADVDLGNVSITNAKLDGMRINGILVVDLIRAHAARSGAVLYAKDIARMQAFYQAVAGLSVERAENDHVALASPAFQLVLHKLPERIAASVEIERPPRRRTETPIKLVFPVASIAAAREMARLHGAELLPPDREWDFQETLVCDGQDPEGNIVQFRQCKPY
jgi:predicted enzyme related to lactoylglutathione lyase